MRWIRRLAFVPVVSVLALLPAGCGDSAATSGSPVPTMPTAGSQAGRTEEPSGIDRADAVTVRIVDEGEFAQVLQGHRGKVVLVDFWATWCPPCVALLSHTVELAERWEERGLVVISVSIDDPENEASVLEKLKSKGATFDNFISRYGGSAKSLDLFDLEDGVLPIYRVYDRSGNVHKTLLSSEAPIHAEDVDRAVEELLGRSSNLR